jgi:thimet oligopeptidase
MKARLALMLLCLGAASAHAQGYVFPTYTSAEQVQQACDGYLADAQQQEKRLQSLTPAQASKQLLRGLDAMTISNEDVLGPLALLNSVHPDKAIRDAADECDLKAQAFNSAFLQNPRVYALLKKLKPTDKIDRQFWRDQLDAFEDSGVGLAPAQQARAQAITAETTKLGQDFAKRIREEKTKLAFTADELEGVPSAVWQSAKKDDFGRYLLGLDSPTFEPVVSLAVQSPTRERMWRAFLNQGGMANIQTLEQLEQLRREYAQLFGYASYADFQLRRRMAKSADKVQDFLAEVKTTVAQRELADLEELRVAKAEHLKRPLADTTLHRWDVAFYSERIRRARFGVDQEQFRPYFPPEASLAFVFGVAERLFGVKYEARPQALWHADAHAYDVRDAKDKHFIGTLFVDLYPRADKYNHAAVWSFRNVSTLAGRKPAAGLVVNFNREGLTLDELETLLHEFGHSLHALLSNTRYASQGGTNVQLDFVEAPSQMLEDWVYDPHVLALFQAVCASCKPVPPELLAQATQARDFGKGVMFARQHLFASYDLALHTKDAPQPLPTWVKMESATPLGHVDGTLFPAGFGHIASGYAAGYYSYLWSLVLAEDLRTAFAADRLSARVGARYRADVLSQGGQVPPAEMMRHFLGRETNSKAFFLALKRQPKDVVLPKAEAAATH